MKCMRLRRELMGERIETVAAMMMLRIGDAFGTINGGTWLASASPVASPLHYFLLSYLNCFQCISNLLLKKYYHP